jgi:hypothetical protein
MCVVAKRSSGAIRYRPYRVSRARRAAAWGLFIGLVAAGIFGAATGATVGSFLDQVLQSGRSAVVDSLRLIGQSPPFNVDQAVSSAKSSALAGAITLGVGMAVAGAIVGALLGTLYGALVHGTRGFPRSLRDSVAAQLPAGGAAVLAWARSQSTDPPVAELVRLGGERGSESALGGRSVTTPWSPPEAAT